MYTKPFAKSAANDVDSVCEYSWMELSASEISGEIFYEGHCFCRVPYEK